MPEADAKRRATAAPPDPAVDHSPCGRHPQFRMTGWYRKRSAAAPFRLFFCLAIARLWSALP